MLVEFRGSKADYLNSVRELWPAGITGYKHDPRLYAQLQSLTRRDVLFTPADILSKIAPAKAKRYSKSNRARSEQQKKRHFVKVSKTVERRHKLRKVLAFILAQNRYST